MSGTDQLFAVDSEPLARDGVLAGRCLQSLQLVRIARHTSHVLPLTRAGVHVVSGRGPDGASNGAGKSSLAEALLLLGADRQWTRARAGAKAVGLLFSESDAQQPAGAYGDAPHGYLASVWVDPAAPDQAVTVWIRIQRSGSDHLQVRVVDGVHLALGDNESERQAEADRIWEQLRGATTYGPGSYGQALFGSAPGSLGYVRSRGADETPDTGLLAVVDGARFRPHDLAREIIDLCGVADQLTLEQQQRKTLASLQEQLAAETRDAEQQAAAEEHHLAAVRARREARGRRDLAEQTWQLYLAVGLRDFSDEYTRVQDKIAARRGDIENKREERAALAKAADGTELRRAAQRLETAEGIKAQRERDRDAVVKHIGVLEEQLKDLTRQMESLASARSAAPSTSWDDAADKLASQQTRRAEIAARQQRLAEEISQAEQDRDTAIAGLTETAAVLRNASISAVPLLDLVELDETDRPVWEPRLSTLAGTVVITESDVNRAAETLADRPGTPLLTIPDDPDTLAPRRPDGRGTHPLDRTLQVLRHRLIAPDPVTRVHDTDLGLVVLGGFGEPQTGRAARIDAAEQTLTRLHAEQRNLETQDTDAAQAEETAQKLLRTVEQASRYAEIADQISDLHQTKQDADEQLETASQTLQSAYNEWAEAHEQCRTLENHQNEAADNMRALDKQINALRDQMRSDETVRDRIPVDAFRQAFHGTDDEAAHLAGEQNQTLAQLRQSAVDQLRQAIDALPDLPGAGLTDETDDPLTAELNALHVWCRRSTAEERPRSFPDVAAALDRWLRATGSNDDDLEERISELRADRTRRLEASQQRIHHNMDIASTAADNAKKLIRKAFRDVATQLQTMWTRAGRDTITLSVHNTEPSSPEEPITWEASLTWQTAPDVPPRRYTDRLNSAETILVHTMLAAAALASVANPRGRMLVIDEFGQNLDMVNMPTTVAVLKQMATYYDLTIVLACQDTAAPLLTGHCDEYLEMRHVNSREPLNRAPHIDGGPQDPTVVTMLEHAWTAGRPLL